MTNLKKIQASLAEMLEKAGVKKYEVQVSEDEKSELNVQQMDFSLLRTNFTGGVVVVTYIDGRRGSAAGNDFSDSGLKTVVDSAVSAALSSPADEAYDFAEKQEAEVFHSGPYEADMDKLYDRMSEFMDTVKADFPKIQLMEMFGSHDRTHTLYTNTNGTVFESFDGAYSIVAAFSANDGENTTGLNYEGFSAKDLEKPIIEYGIMRKLLSDTENSLDTVPMEGKFTGDLILLPDAVGAFSSFLVENFMDGGVIMDGTSLWLDKVGEKVISDKISFSLSIDDERLTNTEHFTANGYRSENVALISNGVLKSHLIGLYVANKTGRPVTKNSSSSVVMEGGDSSLEEMIRATKRGLIVGGFSGGSPNTNGEFSGVAKNSFYVEDGEIKGAVMETMISGNLVDMFNNVISVSREQISNGETVLPYIAFGGITISGK